MVEATPILQDPPSVRSGELMTTIPGSGQDTATTDDFSSLGRQMVAMALDQGRDFALSKLSEAPDLAKYAVTQFATAEFLQLLGIGAGFSTLNMTGFTLAQINKKLDEIKAQVNTILGAPAIEALDNLRRGMQSLEAGKYVMANKEFEEVIKLASKGRIYQKENLQTVTNLTKYLVVADLMTNSYDEDKKLFVPYELLEGSVKILIKRKVTDHLKKLLEAKDNQSLSFLIKFRPGAKKEKQELDQNIVDVVLQNALQFVCPPGYPVPVKFIPEGFEDAALLNMNGKPGKVDSSSIYIFKNGEKVVIRHCQTAKISEIDIEKEDELTFQSTYSGVSRDGQALTIMDNSNDSNHWSKQDQELIVASDKGNNSKLQALLTSGADVNAVNERGSTPLIEASLRGNNDVVTTLLQHPLIQINIQDNGSDTALHHASAKGHNDVVTTLLQHPLIQINIKNEAGYTALIAARGHNDVVTTLLKHPLIQINIKNKEGNTALHCAANMGHLDVVKQLVTASADLTLVNREGKTPVQVAKKQLPWGIHKIYQERQDAVYNYLKMVCGIEDPPLSFLQGMLIMLGARTF